MYLYLCIHMDTYTCIYIHMYICVVYPYICITNKFAREKYTHLHKYSLS